MDKVYTGAALKNWFLNNDDVFRLLRHNSIGGYSVLNLDELDDKEHYTTRHYDHRSFVIERVKIVTE